MLVPGKSRNDPMLDRMMSIRCAPGSKFPDNDEVLISVAQQFDLTLELKRSAEVREQPWRSLASSQVACAILRLSSLTGMVKASYVQEH